MTADDRAWPAGDVTRAVLLGLMFAAFAVLLWPLTALLVLAWVATTLSRWVRASAAPGTAPDRAPMRAGPRPPEVISRARTLYRSGSAPRPGSRG
jgi:hypothetical protein